MLSTLRPSGFLIDATGVLYDSEAGSDGRPIPGSIEAIQKLKDRRIPFRILSNASTKTPAEFVAKLQRLGFGLETDDVISAIPAAKDYCKVKNLRPACFVGKEVKDFFSDIHTEDDPDCLILSFLDEGFSHSNIERMVSILGSMEKPLLITVGNGQVFKRTTGLFLDVGTFAHMLIYATGCEQVVVGKPSPAYFQAGLYSLNLAAEEVIMIGDDYEGDIVGAQSNGIKAVQVKTGKYRSSTQYSKGDPFNVVDNLRAAIDLFVI